ncbi:MAG TPA: hypothetical protein DCQ99_01040 [Nitrospinae bacterium]|nr:hypothetical protein [Nitrospinota bacterium]HBA25928.1 hypothetical protein [Nitrospinota bacterium]
MSTTSKISRSLIDVVNTIEPEGDINFKVKHIIENELIRRLNRYELTIRILENKYGMSLSEFKKKKVVVKKGYSYEVENDLWEWESSQDGVKTVKTEIKKLKTT